MMESAMPRMRRIEREDAMTALYILIGLFIIWGIIAYGFAQD